MAVLVNAPRTGLRTLDDVIEMLAVGPHLPLRIKMLGLILRRIAQNAFQRVLS
jgi:hypothetical protein